MTTNKQQRRLRRTVIVVLALYALVIGSAIVLAVLGHAPWHTPFVGIGFVIYLGLRRWDDGSWDFLRVAATAQTNAGDSA